MLAQAALFVDDLGQIVQFVGAISGFGLFVLPCVVYINLKYKDRAPLQRACTGVGVLTIVGVRCSASTHAFCPTHIAACGADD